MTVMFGIKLDEELDRRVSALARARGQAKSEIGRRALIEYLERHVLDAEFKRQIESLAGEDTSDLADLEAMAVRAPDAK